MAASHPATPTRHASHPATPTPPPTATGHDLTPPADAISDLVLFVDRLPSTTVDEAVVGPSGSASKAEDGSVNEDEGWVLPIEKESSLYWKWGRRKDAGK
ncbi:hypothetical protein LR48_Vigan216s000500 [Vigna angularis]|uniref:Uncharacterized protein n=1 Tax=Phaseolus angularis TaxID=3914 RepID=A0A0L9T631_PHAAN|nr:hypothetical protein LR48_Vigan216s000500 [Vigna angularis]